MISTLSFVLGLVLAVPAGPKNIWLPTPGGAGERAIQALAMGGDDALYAAGGGLVWRMAPGQKWQAVGRYVPKMVIDISGEVSTEGIFSSAFSDQVIIELETALQATLGEELDASAVSEEVLLGVLEAYIDEPDPRPESAFAVARMVPTHDGVWLATGGGLFRATALGVSGPTSKLRPILDVISTADGMTAVSHRGLYKILDGEASLWRQYDASSLTVLRGRVAFIAEDTIWWTDPSTGPQEIKPPTGVPLHIASGGNALWVATQFALYRHSEEGWHLCPSLPSSPSSLQIIDGTTIVVLEDSIYTTDSTCAEWQGHDAPWNLRFTGATLSRAGLWGATTDGVFLLTPGDDDLRDAVAIEEFRRKLKALPTFEDTYNAALNYHQLDPEQSGYGLRPVWSTLLPDVKAVVQTHPLRVERQPTFLGGTPQVSTSPAGTEYQVMALWNVRFDLLSLFQQTDVDGVQDSENVDTVSENTEDEVVFDLDDTGTAGELADAALSMAVSERKQIRKNRFALNQTMRRLYRDRQRLTYSLHVLSKISVLDLLQVDEIDARLDAYTNGMWSARRKDR